MCLNFLPHLYKNIHVYSYLVCNIFLSKFLNVLIFFHIYIKIFMFGWESLVQNINEPSTNQNHWLRVIAQWEAGECSSLLRLLQIDNSILLALGCSLRALCAGCASILQNKYIHYKDRALVTPLLLEDRCPLLISPQQTEHLNSILLELYMYIRFKLKL